jgi:translation initiation factor IF-3
LSRPYPPRQQSSHSFVRVNGKIRAREVRVVGDNGAQLGVMTLTEAMGLARQRGVDLVEIAANATPPVCRLVDFGKYRYEQAKKDKESKKHQHANRVKEVQLSANIDPHDFGVKLAHAVEFMCEDMKVKVTLRFRGREMAHQEIGLGKVHDFIREIAPWGHPDAPPKTMGKSVNVMLSPLPRNKRAINPNEGKKLEPMKDEVHEDDDDHDEEGGDENEGGNEVSNGAPEPKGPQAGAAKEKPNASTEATEGETVPAAQ